jgi:hypothetical protein
MFRNCWNSPGDSKSPGEFQQLRNMSLFLLSPTKVHCSIVFLFETFAALLKQFAGQCVLAFFESVQKWDTPQRRATLYTNNHPSATVPP